MSTLAETWIDVVTVGLLGTDRREPPELPAGPLADAVADAVRPTPQGRLLASVAAMVVARRCGARPLPPSPPLMPPDDDPRPLLPVAAARRWYRIVADHPVLEAEWLALAARSGCRPAPDILVALLRRHTRSPVVANAVLAWGGATAAWLVEHAPELAPAESRPVAPVPDARVLPVPAELDPLLAGPPAELVGALLDGLVIGTFKWSHRAVLLNAIARIDPASLPLVIAALRRGRDAVAAGEGDPETVTAPLAMWEALIELATVRRDMLDELARPA
ncbi:MAG: hypothetical protein ACRD0G_19425 [Acidimicrobiales bacterium]